MGGGNGRFAMGLFFFFFFGLCIYCASFMLMAVTGSYVMS